MTETLDGLARRLTAAPEAELTLTFDELERLVGRLPPLARRYPHWWGNNGPSEQARAWLDAGFRVSAVELEGFVTFVRVRDRLARLEILQADDSAEAVMGTLELRDGVVVLDEAHAGCSVRSHDGSLNVPTRS